MLKLFMCWMLVYPIDLQKEHGLFVSALWLMQEYGVAGATDPANDVDLKSCLAKGLANDSKLTFSEIGAYMSREQFQDVAGSDDSIAAQDVAGALLKASPASRAQLNTNVRDHLEYLTTTFDMIDEHHREAAQKLAHWMVTTCDDGKPVEVIVVCTGNSRRSMMGSTMGNLAAAYYGFGNVRFYSGGTAPSAFNSRAIAALAEIGVEIDVTDEEAVRGELETPNPICRMRWGAGLEATEFSKRYADPSNPQSGFAAVMVCTEADDACPAVAGAALRLSMPFLDPKTYDGSALEARKYAERRDDIGRTLLSVMCQLRRAIDGRSD